MRILKESSLVKRRICFHLQRNRAQRENVPCEGVNGKTGPSWHLETHFIPVRYDLFICCCISQLKAYVILMLYWLPACFGPTEVL